MKVLGQVTKLTKSGQVLVRSRELPAIYGEIVNENKKIVGKVSDIIGPKMDPYIVIKPIKGTKIEKGQKLFESKKKRDKRWKKKR